MAASIDPIESFDGKLVISKLLILKQKFNNFHFNIRRHSSNDVNENNSTIKKKLCKYEGVGYI